MATGRHRDYLLTQWENLASAERQFNKTPTDYERLEHYENARARWEEAKFTMAQLAHQPDSFFKVGFNRLKSVIHQVMSLPDKLRMTLSRLPVLGSFFTVKPVKKAVVAKGNKLAINA